MSVFPGHVLTLGQIVQEFHVLHAGFPEIKSVFTMRAILVACSCIFGQIPELLYVLMESIGRVSLWIYLVYAEFHSGYTQPHYKQSLILYLIIIVSLWVY
jgi:hypothetical protein